jgi:polyisoprenoid-binding protein YceI
MKPQSILLLSAIPVLALSFAFAGPQDKDKKALDPSGTYKIDPVHSTVIFKVMHAQSSWAFGRFDKVGGSFTFDAAKPENSKVEVTIQTTSVNTADGKRDDHLRSPDFFDVKTFPTATFKSTAVAKKGERMYAVTGDLALHGVTKSVTLDMEHTGGIENPKMGKLAGFYGTLTIPRADYGMKYGTGMLGEDVQLMISIEGGIEK